MVYVKDDLTYAWTVAPFLGIDTQLNTTSPWIGNVINYMGSAYFAVQ